jgi:hypothetical protein
MVQQQRKKKCSAQMDGAKIHRPINVILHYTEEKKSNQRS